MVTGGTVVTLVDREGRTSGRYRRRCVCLSTTPYCWNAWGGGPWVKQYTGGANQDRAGQGRADVPKSLERVAVLPQQAEPVLLTDDIRTDPAAPVVVPEGHGTVRARCGVAGDVRAPPTSNAPASSNSLHRLRMPLSFQRATDRP